MTRGDRKNVLRELQHHYRLDGPCSKTSLLLKVRILPRTLDPGPKKRFRIVLELLHPATVAHRLADERELDGNALSVERVQTRIAPVCFARLEIRREYFLQ